MEILPRKTEELRRAAAPAAEADFGWTHTGRFCVEPAFHMPHQADAMMYEEKRAGGGR